MEYAEKIEFMLDFCLFLCYSGKAEHTRMGMTWTVPQCGPMVRNHTEAKTKSKGERK